MNEARYFMFWFYYIDLHNLEVEGLDSSVPDPRGEFRRTQFKVIPVDFMNLPHKQTEQVHELSEQLSSLKVKPSEESPVKCTLCGAGYKTEAYLKIHMKEKHNDVKDDKKAECLECGKILFNKQSLEKHIIALHRKCKVCNIQFDTKMEKVEHMKMHTTCSICDITFPYESKLKRHMLSVHK